jgi:hypothetical protein
LSITGILKNWGKVGNIIFKPKVGADITKIIFAQFKWVVKENNK